MDQVTVLALRAKAGDGKALDDFVRSTSPDVHRLCRYLGFPADPDDLTQETFERALRALHRFRGDGSGRAWVLAIARRVCADATRKAIRGRRLRGRLEAVAPAASHVDETWVEIDELLRGLDEDRREAFVLTQLVGLSYEDAAAAVGCPIGTIRSRAARARQQLISDAGVGEALAG